ncbi:hypothetical protein [Crenalkalicoccus roseus]|uniref:hypothetical protein n=1 Tax=Crenalkalicoccus roseus TaxID=1485588 RepID=UPI001080DC28|nr:hypothetical protein [Crenalkalicoccus roseus]
MQDAAEAEIIEIGDLSPEEWTDYAIAQGWSDGLPLAIPTEAAVERLVALCRGDNEPFPPISPRQVVPTLRSLAANAVMAGCRPDYFPVVLAALRGVLRPEYNLHGTLATTHPCAPMVLVSGPARHALGLNCGTNCFGQGNRANATIGRALELILLNIGGARPGVMDRATQGSPAKYSFCFGENQEESPWAPYHVRRGFAPEDSVVTVMAGEGPHNINDHASTTGEGILTTIAQSIAQPGSNNIYGKGPYVLVLGPEHAATLARDGWTIEALQQALFERARVHVSRVSPENVRQYVDSGHPPVDDHLLLAPTPEDIHILVAGGAGKHSAWIPSFGGTAVCSVKVRAPA